MNTLESKLRALVAHWKAESKRIKEMADKERSKASKDSLMAQSVRYWMCADELAEALLAERQPVDTAIVDLAQEILKPHWPVVRNMEENEARQREVERIINVLKRVAVPALAERQEPPLAERLAEHWLSQMNCDHNMQRDRAVCCCGFVTIWEPTIGDAAKAWAEHALNAAAAPSSGTGENR